MEEIGDLLHEAAVEALNARNWLARGNLNQAKVCSRRAASLLDRAELAMVKEIAAREDELQEGVA